MSFHWHGFLARCFLQQIVGRVFDCGKVCRGKTGSDAAFVLPESHVHHPMQIVFDLPVVSDNPGHILWLDIERRNVIAPARFGFTFDFAHVFDPGDA